MARNFWMQVKEVIHRADILLEVLDARLPDETRNLELERKITEIGKKVIFVLNKADLVPQELLEKEKKRLQKIFPTIFVSSRLHQGTKMLRDEIMKNVKIDKQIKVGVLGYPNVGKSSIINVLKGKRSAPTSSFSGYTKGLRDVRITNKITLVDTPGVIPFMERDEFKHALIGTKNVQQIKDPENIAIEMMHYIETKGINVAKFYNSKKGSDELETLENIAISQNKLLKRGIADTEKMAKIIIKDWQEGKIRVE